MGVAKRKPRLQGVHEVGWGCISTIVAQGVGTVTYAVTTVFLASLSGAASSSRLASGLAFAAQVLLALCGAVLLRRLLRTSSASPGTAAATAADPDGSEAAAAAGDEAAAAAPAGQPNSAAGVGALEQDDRPAADGVETRSASITFAA